jgi:hypothetical protein
MGVKLQVSFLRPDSRYSCSRKILIFKLPAGADLALQLISHRHIHYPLEGVRLLNLPARIRGIYLLSPWVR